MNDLEKLALRQIQTLSGKGEQMITQSALKSHSEEKINAEKDLYPIASIFREMGSWAEAITKNQKP